MNRQEILQTVTAMADKLHEIEQSTAFEDGAITPKELTIMTDCRRRLTKLEKSLQAKAKG